MKRRLVGLSLLFVAVPAAHAQDPSAPDPEPAVAVATCLEADSPTELMALAEELAGDPRGTCELLAAALSRLAPRDAASLDSLREERVNARLRELSRMAFARSADRALLLRSVGEASLPAALAGGLLEGLAQGAAEAPLNLQPGSPTASLLRGLMADGDPALAAQALGLLGGQAFEVDAWWAQLLAGLEAAAEPVREAAGRALRARTGQRLPPKAAVWRAWRRRVLLGRMPELSAQLEAGGSEAQASARAVVLELLARDPAEPLALLSEHADEASPSLQELIASAFLESPAREEILAAAVAPEAPLFLAAGLPQGLRRRAASGAPGCEAYSAVLLELLAERPQPAVREHALRAIPACVEELDEFWFELLCDELLHEEPAVREAAWIALRRLSGAFLGPFPGDWRRWWREQEEDEAIDQALATREEGGAWGGPMARRLGRHAGAAPPAIDHAALSGGVRPSARRDLPRPRDIPEPEARSAHTPLFGLAGLLLLGSLGWVIQRPVAEPRSSTFVLDSAAPKAPPRRVPTTRRLSRADLMERARGLLPTRRMKRPDGATSSIPVTRRLPRQETESGRLRFADDPQPATGAGEVHLVETLARAATRRFRRSDLGSSGGRTQTRRLSLSELEARRARGRAHDRAQRERREQAMLDELNREVGMVSFGAGEDE